MTFEKLLTELRAMFTENIDNVQIFFKANKNEAQVYVNNKYCLLYKWTTKKKWNIVFIGVDACVEISDGKYTKTYSIGDTILLDEDHKFLFYWTTKKKWNIVFIERLQI
jgi:hypothetical protein